MRCCWAANWARNSWKFDSGCWASIGLSRIWGIAAPAAAAVPERACDWLCVTLAGRTEAAGRFPLMEADGGDVLRTELKDDIMA